MKQQILSIIYMGTWAAVLYFSIKDWDMSATITNGSAVWLMAWAVTWLIITRK